MNNNYETEYEVDLIQALWEILLRWKPMVLIGLLATVFIFGYLNILGEDVRKQPNIVTVDEYDLLVKELKQNLSNDDIAEVEDLVYRVQALFDLREYSHDAAIMRINPNKARELVVYYQIDALSDSESSKLVHQFNNAVVSDAFANALNKVVSNNGEDVYVADLIRIDTDSSQSLYSMASSELPVTTADTTIDALTTTTVLNEDAANYLSIRMLLLEEWDDVAIKNTIREYVDDLNLSQHLVYSDAAVGHVHSDVAYTRQATTRTRIASEQNQISTAVELLNGFNSDDKDGQRLETQSGAAKLFFVELKKLGLKKTGKVDPSGVRSEVADDSTMQVSSGKMLIAGFLVGIITFTGLLLLYWILIPKTGRVMGVGCLETLPAMGLVVGKDKKNVFWISPFVERLRDKHRESRETALKNAVSSIEFFRNNTAEEIISLVTIGSVKDSTSQVLEELRKKYAAETQKELAVVSLPTETDKQEQLYKELDNLSGAVVVVTEYDVTPLRTLDRMVRLMAEKDIKIIGSLGVE